MNHIHRFKIIVMNVFSELLLLLKKVRNLFLNKRTASDLPQSNIKSGVVEDENKKNDNSNNSRETNGRQTVPQINVYDKGESRLSPQNMLVRETTKPHTILTIPFLKSNINIDYSKVYKVNYTISNTNEECFPIVRVPKNGCEIKLPVIGRSGKRGVCEQKLCDTINSLGLKDFYDCFSLFVGSNTVAYEPDLVYIDLSKSIFIDIEIDEPYAGWECMPIHYKTSGGTIDDKRNDCFTERGWTVIRFTEEQVYRYPKSCLKYVYQQLEKINLSISIPSCFNNVDDLEKDNMWTEEEARRMIAQNKREKMLGISEFIMPKELDNVASIKDYPEGKRIEASIIRKKQSIKHINDVSYITEAIEYELPQRVTTKSSFKTTPSSRGYA